MNLETLTEDLKAAATKLGFSLVGVVPAVPPDGLAQFHEWLDRGFDGEMTYLRERAPAYEHPRSVLDGARSVMMLAFPYRTVEPQVATIGRGRVSRYAWNETDYHDLIHERLKQLQGILLEMQPMALGRGVIDTAPLLERDLARRAGLGWIGKHTLLINRQAGSWFFLAAFLTDQELVYDQAHETDHCGTCRACLDACPTQAFPEPYVLDARRCISYLTIELRTDVPRELRTEMGDWLFGCDVCQEVCPWNGRAPAGDHELFAPAVNLNPVTLATLFELDESGFRNRFRRTALWRSKRRGLLRNAAIVLGNQRSPTAIEPLARGLADDDPLVRGACAWALGQIGGDRSRELLTSRLSIESETGVVAEIQAALARWSTTMTLPGLV